MPAQKLPPVDLGGITLYFLDGGTMQVGVPMGRDLRLSLALRPVLVKGWWGTALLDCGPGECDSAKRQRYQIRAPRVSLANQLEQLGVKRGGIDLVVISHLHFDHAGGALEKGKKAFPGAEYILQEKEMQRVRQGTASGRIAEALDRCGVRLVSGRVALAPGLEVMPAPGHTAGHQVCRVKGTCGQAWFLADLVPIARSLTLCRDRFSDHEPDLALEKRRLAVTRMVEKRALAIYYHDPCRAYSSVAWRIEGKIAQPVSGTRLAAC